MTEQQIDLRGRELDYWMTRAHEAEGKLWKAEKRLSAWMEHWSATARTGAVDEVAAVLEANARADQAEARIERLEDTSRVLVKEALAAEDARDEHRRGKAAAEARIKAVRDVHWADKALNGHTCAEDGHDWPCPTVRALESVPPPSA